MRSLFRMRTDGYTHLCVKRQCYFSLESLCCETNTTENLCTQHLFSGEEIERAKDLFRESLRSEFRYLTHQVYQLDVEHDVLTSLYLSIVDTTTGNEVLHIGKEQYDELIFADGMQRRSDIPRKPALLAVSERGVKLLTDLTPASFWVIRNTQTMVKRLSVDPISPPTVKEILKMPILQSWLPTDTYFDLDRVPSEEYLKENPVPGRNYPRWEYDVNKNIYSRHRWVRYCDAKMTWHPDTTWCSIPQDAIPEDRSILMIPMRHKNSTLVRNCNDDFMMYVEIIYRAKPAASDSHDTGTLSEIKSF